MSTPPSYHNYDCNIKEYIDGFVSLLKKHLGENLKGIYLHGSLAMGSLYPPKSDIDIIAVVYHNLPPEQAEGLNVDIAHYNKKRPIYGYIEFCLINADTAGDVPDKIPYILHYSSSWHERILSGEVVYVDNMTDIDLSAHLTVLKNRGICLYGGAIDEVFGEVNWDAFVFAVTDDLKWIIDDENICESPYYAILNICRVLQILTDKNNRCLSKDEGGQWGLVNLPAEYRELIQKALDAYCTDYYPIDEADCMTGGVVWDNEYLLRFRDYAKKI